MYIVYPFDIQHVKLAKACDFTKLLGTTTEISKGEGAGSTTQHCQMGGQSHMVAGSRGATQWRNYGGHVAPYEICGNAVK